MENKSAYDMFRQIPVYLVSICLLSLLSFRHPYHVSVTTLNYTKAEKTLAIEIKVFYHDLEPAVNQFGHTEIDIKNHQDQAQRDSLVMAYTNSHFEVSVDGKEQTCKKKAIDFKDEYIFIKLSCESVEGKNLEVKNSILFEKERSQTNLFHFVTAGKKLTKKTVNPNAEVSFAL